MSDIYGWLKEMAEVHPAHRYGEAVAEIERLRAENDKLIEERDELRGELLLAQRSPGYYVK